MCAGQGPPVRCAGTAGQATHESPPTLLQPGVNAPGTPNSTPFLPANSSLRLTD